MDSDFRIFTESLSSGFKSEGSERRNEEKTTPGFIQG